MQEAEGPSPDRTSSSAIRRAFPFRSAPPLPTQPPQICRFLALEEADDAIGPPIPAVDPRHRCVAIGDAVPQSSRQQELVCLTAAHATCPRYVHGVALTEGAPAPRESVSPAVIVAALVFVAAIAASFAFLVIRGGFEFAVAAGGTPSQIAAAPSTSAAPATAGPRPTGPVPTRSPTPASTASTTASGSPTATPAPTPTSIPVPTARPRPTPAPTSDRFAVLSKCPSTSDCWIYVVRSGDNLVSIAHYFGVDYGRVRAMNPSLAVPIRAGARLRIPTPTR